MSGEELVMMVNNGTYKCKIEGGEILVVDEEGRLRGKMKEWIPPTFDNTPKNLTEEERREYRAHITRIARENKKRAEQGLLPINKDGKERSARAKSGEGDSKTRHRQAQQRYRKKQAEKKIQEKISGSVL